jgi:hypothetical protein
MRNERMTGIRPNELGAQLSLGPEQKNPHFEGGFSQPLAISVSAICTAFSAAPFQRLSPTTQNARA